jgi:hypothetical protein
MAAYVREGLLLIRQVSTIDFNLIGTATVLIAHDFDWESDGDREGSPRPAAEASDAGVRGPIPGRCPPGGSSEPRPEIVIIERSRGFSRGILALAIVALVLSSTSKFCKTRRANAKAIGDRTGIPAERRPQVPADPGRRPADGIRRGRAEVERGEPARRDRLGEEAGSIR